VPGRLYGTALRIPASVVLIIAQSGVDHCTEWSCKQLRLYTMVARLAEPVLSKHSVLCRICWTFCWSPAPHRRSSSPRSWQPTSQRQQRWPALVAEQVSKVCLVAQAVQVYRQ